MKRTIAPPLTQSSRRPLITALEPRVLLDGALAATAEHVSSDLDLHPDKAVAGVDVAAIAPTMVKPAEPVQNGGRKEVVFIDSNIDNFQSLVQQVGAGIEIELIDSTQNGMTQIATWAASHQGYDTISIISHGSDGELDLGTATLSQDTLVTYHDDLVKLGQSLTADGDLQLYGCDIAETASGRNFVDSLARLTGADVAASVDLTGSSALGGDWSLEYTSGTIDGGLFTGPEQATVSDYAYTLNTSFNLSGKDGWTAVMYGSTQDPASDSQANAADTDIIGDAAHGSLYVAYDDNGTSSTLDDLVSFRVRIDNPTSSTYFGGVAIIGMDANLDGRIDVFLSVDGRNNGQVIRILDPGTDLNNSPSTTSTMPLPTGWIASNGTYAMSAANYSVVAVSSATDPDWGSAVTGLSGASASDLNGDGKTDVFVSFKIPLADLASVLSIASPVDRNGNYGPRAATGIAGFTKDTAVQYVNFTQTQFGPINGDLNGVGSSYDKNATFVSLGAFTSIMTASSPVSASSFAHLTDPLDANGYLNGTEDNALTVHGTATANGWVMLTVTDGTHSTSSWTQAGNDGSWSVTTADLSGFNEGTLTFQSTLVSGNGSASAVAGSSGDATTVQHDTIPPAVAITPLLTSGFPVISGTSTDVPAGSVLTVTVDPNGDGVLTDLVTYTVLVGSGGTWSVNTAVAAPVSGTLSAAGLTSYAKITASGQDVAGNTGSVTALDKPSVASLTTQSTAPTISGTWGGSQGGSDALTVTVNGVSYSPTINDKTWTVTLSGNTGIHALVAGQSYDVTASVTRGGTTVTDTSSAELTIVSGPVVNITGDATATTANAKPTLSGTSTPDAVIQLQIDLDNNNSTTSDRVIYAVVTDNAGNWSIDLAAATPMSGTLPAAGLSGTVWVLATVTDASNHTAIDTQALTITVPSISIASITGAAPVTSGTAHDGILNGTEDDASVIYLNASNVDHSQTIAVTVSDGVHANVTGTATYDATSGQWKATLNLSSLNEGTNALTIQASYNLGQATASTTVSHDSEAFATVLSAQTTNATPTVTGTADATSGSLVIKVERYTKQSNVIQYKDTTYYSVAGGTVSGYTTSSGVSFSSGNWSLTVSQSGGTFNNTGEYLLTTVIGTDSAGNSVSASGQVTKIASNSTANTVSIGTIAGDNSISEAEDDSVTISGTTTLSGGYVLVSLTDGTNTLSQQVQASGTSWSLSGLNLNNWKDGSILVEARLLSGNASSTVLASAAATPVHVNTITSTPSIAISEPIGDGNLSDAEDNAVTLSGTTNNAANGTVVALTVTDGGGHSVTTSATVSNGAWTTTADLSALNEGSLTVSASIPDGAGTVSDSAAVLHDVTPPVIAVTPLATAGFPTVSGTSDLPAGSVLTVTIDADNDASSGSNVSYHVTVQNGGGWSLDLTSATPVSGSLDSDGLSAHALISVSGTDAAGNTSTAYALDKPTVTAQVTHLSTPRLTGNWTYRSGDVLSVNVDGHTYTAGDGHLVASSNNTWYLDIPVVNALASNTYSVTASVTRSGSTVHDVTASELIVDTTAPAVVISGISQDTGYLGSDYLTQDNQLVFSGTAEADSSVLVVLTDHAGQVVFSATVVATGGNWSLDRSGQTALDDGTYTLTATATDLAGNTATTTHAVTIDTTATIGITSNYKSASGSPQITGTSDLESGQAIEVTLVVNEIQTYTYTTTVDSDGTWSVDTGSVSPAETGYPVTFADTDTLVIQASGQDQAGNTAETSRTMMIDLSAPDIRILTPLDWNGDVVNQKLSVTEDGNVVIRGSTSKGGVSTALAGSSLVITLTDGSLTIRDTAVIQSDGSWQLDPLNLRSMASGTITVTATYTDEGGVVYTDTATVLHDKSVTVSIDSIGVDTGGLGDFITADNALMFYGSATPLSTVTLDLPGVFSGVQVTADAHGNWVYDGTGHVISAGNHTLTASVGSDSVNQSIVIDTSTPDGPVTVTLQTTTDTTPVVAGSVTLAAGEQLSVMLNGKTYIQGDGNLSVSGSDWILNIPAADALDAAVSGGFNGVYSVSAKITDLAGNQLVDSSSGELTVLAVSSVPAQTVSIDSMTRDSGAADFITSDGGASRSVSGHLSAGLGTDEVVEVSMDGGSSWQTATTSGTGWSISDSGSHASNWTIQARVTNTAASVSGTAASQSVLYDATAPATPTVTSQTTTDTTPVISGTATVGAGETLRVTVNGQTYTAGDGHLSRSGSTWSLSLPDAAALTASQTYAVTATVTDLAGNSSSDSTTSELAVVTGPAQTVSIDSMTRDSGAADFITSDGGASRSVSGHLSAGLGTDEVVEVSMDGGSSWQTATTSGTGWSISDSGSHASNWTIQARVTNTAASVSGTAASQSVLYDATAPATPTVTSQTTTDTTPVISGTATVGAGESLSVTVNGQTYTVGDGHLSRSGSTWSLSLPDAAVLTAGQTYAVTATVTDLAGNVTARTGDVSIMAIPPEIPLPPVTPPGITPPVPAETPVAMVDLPPPSVVPPPFIPVPGSLFVPPAPGLAAPSGPLAPATLPPLFTSGGSSLPVMAELNHPLGTLFVVTPAPEHSVIQVNVGTDGQIQFAATGNDIGGLSVKNVQITGNNILISLIDIQKAQHYSATLSDGTVLPDWIQIDPASGALTIKSSVNPAQTKVTIRIMATDAKGQVRALDVEVDLKELQQPKENNTQASTDHLPAYLTFSQQLQQATQDSQHYGERLMSLLDA